MKPSEYKGRETKLDRGVGYVICYEVQPGGHWMTFVVIDVVGWIENGARLYASNGVGCTDIDEADQVANGSIKRDGCADLDIGLEDSYRTHFCSRDCIDELAAKLKAVYSVAERVMKQ